MNELFSPRTVMIVDDDPSCRALVRATFDRSDRFAVLAEFDGLEDFCRSLPVDPEKLQNYLPDLVVMDVLSAREHQFRNNGLNGAMLCMYLRINGLRFSTLLMSGMESPSLLDYITSEVPMGWAFVLKDLTLNSASIENAANQALESLA